MPKATQIEMRRRYDTLYAICEAEHPVSVRGVYYRTLGTSLEFARKDNAWAHAVSNALTTMRREGWMPWPNKRRGRMFLPHGWITEPGRNTLVPNTWDSLGDRMRSLAEGFRRTLWTDDDPYVEIWSEAATMIGVLSGVTDDLDVYLRPAQGFSSETLSWNAAQDINSRKRETFIYQVGDFDPYGMEAWQCVQSRLGELVDVPVHFERIAATVEDRDRYIDLTHPVKRPKNEHSGHVSRMQKHVDLYGERVLEVEAIPTPDLRARVREAIMGHIDQDQIDAALARQAEDCAELERLADEASGI